MSEKSTTPPGPSRAEVESLAQAVLRELQHFGPQPPFVAYVKALEGEKEQRFFICRHQRPSEPDPTSEHVEYVSYKAPLGRLAAVGAGEKGVIKVPEVVGLKATGYFWETEYSVQEKNLFEARQNDALKNDTSFPSGRLFVPSLRSFLEGLHAAKEAEVAGAEMLKPARRRVVDKFELQDLAIVDKYQDDIFRIPLSTFLLIYGAPGTGKTTTIIKRLAQKTDPDFLLENKEIAANEVDALRPAFYGPTNWVLFIPSELLRGYLKEALAQERLAATEENVLVWQEYRVTVARDTLRVLKTGSRGTFVLRDGLVDEPASARLASWTQSFERYFQEAVAAQFAREVGAGEIELKAVREKAVAAIRASEDEVRPLQREVEELRIQETRARSEKENESIRRNLTELEGKIQARLAPVAEIRLLVDTWNHLIEEARAARSPSPRSAAVIARRVRSLDDSYKMQVDRLREQREFASLAASHAPELGANHLRSALTKLLRDHSLDAILSRLAPLYQAFRLGQLNEEAFFMRSAAEMVKERRIDPFELDTLIYVALSLLRETLQPVEMSQRSGSSLSQLLINEMRMVVTADEASDFSATQLACMRLLAHPRFDSTAFSGDLMQRMTSQGIQHWNELETFGPTPRHCELRVSYRQSPRLLEIAAALYHSTVGDPAPFESAFTESPEDPFALTFHASSAEASARWIADRIVEIYSSTDERLPSIAVLVPTEADVQPTYSLLKPTLLEQSIEAEACIDGRVLGTKAKVRVFNVEFIKGLEFEAVFFVGIDQIASKAPELVARYLYVGLTRARSFLAVTHFSGFPPQLEFVQGHFAASNWATVTSDRL